MAILAIVIGVILLVVGYTVPMEPVGRRLCTAFGIVLLVLGVLLLLLPLSGVTVIR